MNQAFPRNRYFVFLVLAVFGVLLDLMSKHQVFKQLNYPNGNTDWLLTGWVSFKLHTTLNQGALWGVGQGMTELFAGLSMLASGFIIYWLFIRGAARSLWLTFALGFIMAGTLGNLYDRLGLHGCVDPMTGETWYAVRDFFLFRLGTYHWPVFNVADIFLVTGAIMLFLQSLTPEPATDRETVPPARETVQVGS